MFIRSIINYGSPSYHLASKTYLKMLGLVHNNAINSLLMHFVS